MTETASALPPYRVRESPRARRVRFVVTARDGLVVVVPRGFAHARIPALLATRRAWADAALARVAERRALYAGGPAALLPQHVELRATGERFVVVKVPTSSASVRVLEREGRLELRGACADDAACLAALGRWLDRAAKSRLVVWLRELADAHGYQVTAARVRRQRTRWGSCTARASISLNRALVFLPPDLARSVLLHELAHTRHLDHSDAFWREVQRVDPRALEHRRLLRGAADLVPAWADV